MEARRAQATEPASSSQRPIDQDASRRGELSKSDRSGTRDRDLIGSSVGSTLSGMSAMFKRRFDLTSSNKDKDKDKDKDKHSSGDKDKDKEKEKTSNISPTTWNGR